MFDAELTRQSRAKRTEVLWAADEYQPGQLIIKRGDLVDARTKAVLDQLRERTAGEQAKNEPPREQPAPPVIAPAREADAQPKIIAQALPGPPAGAEQNHWLLPGILKNVLERRQRRGIPGQS